MIGLRGPLLRAMFALVHGIHGVRSRFLFFVVVENSFTFNVVNLIYSYALSLACLCIFYGGGPW